MDIIKVELERHPQASSIDVEQSAALMGALVECEVVCKLCADACLSETDVSMLSRCIELDELCAAVCAATVTTATHFGMQGAEGRLMRLQLEACAAVCAECADECAKHQDMHEHCRVCAQACRRAEQYCRTALFSHDKANLASV